MALHPGRLPNTHPCDSEHVLAPRSTPALDLLVAVGEVVVGEFLTHFDVSAGDDPDLAGDNIAVAIGRA